MRSTKNPSGSRCYMYSYSSARFFIHETMFEQVELNRSSGFAKETLHIVRLFFHITFSSVKKSTFNLYPERCNDEKKLWGKIILNGLKPSSTKRQATQHNLQAHLYCTSHICNFSHVYAANDMSGKFKIINFFKIKNIQVPEISAAFDIGLEFHHEFLTM